jgi:peptidoglycan/LPS O-acetylase OafA/YrhL
MKLHYRPEIDGLRALAVLPILFFHAGFKKFEGGYVGVDIFFVISGYLITTIIMRQLQEGGFSFFEFYERRARRLLPALFFVLLISSGYAWIWLLPNDLRDFSNSVWAVLLFASNFFFWKDSGYFSIVAEFRPLIHTWSLAVEEQYYLIFPILLVVLAHKKRQFVVFALTAIAIASLFFAQWATTNAPSVGFFLLPSRIWEFILGSLTAYYLANHKHPISVASKTRHELASLIGVGCIAYALFFFKKELAYPSLWTLIPTIGTSLLLIFATQGTYCGRVLALEPIRTIGLMSYSVYLWHQPLFAFARLRQVDDLSLGVTWALITLSIVLGYFTQRVIEPVWRTGAFAKSKLFFYLVGLSCLLLIIFCVATRFVNLETFRFKHLPEDYFKKSWIDYKFHGLNGQQCYTDHMIPCHVAKSANPNSRRVLMVGDSHAGDFGHNFKRYLDRFDLSGSQFSVPGCTFMISQKGRNSGDCGLAREQILDLSKAKAFDVYLFIGQFTDSTEQATAEQREADLQSFKALLNGLLDSGAQVIFFKQRVTLQRDPQKAGALNKRDENRVIANSVDNRIAWQLLLDDLAKNKNFKVFDSAEPLIMAGCGQADCFDGHAKSGYLLYRDVTHLTDLGAKTVFDAYINKLGVP